MTTDSFYVWGFWIVLVSSWLWNARVREKTREMRIRNEWLERECKRLSHEIELDRRRALDARLQQVEHIYQCHKCGDCDFWDPFLKKFEKCGRRFTSEASE